VYTTRRLVVWAVEGAAWIGTALSVALFGWGVWPLPRHTQVVGLALPEEAPIQSAARFVFQPAMRAGDSQIVELHVEGKKEAATPMVLAARLDLPLTEVRPSEAVSTTLAEGRGASFYWEVKPHFVEEVRGRLWMYLRRPSHAAGGEEGQQVIAAPAVVIRSTSWWGWTGRQARMWGLVGMLAGAVMAFVGRRLRGLHIFVRAHTEIYDDDHPKN